MFKEIAKREFANGVVYALQTGDGYPIEVTDTFLPAYTKDAIGRKQNKLNNYELGSRKDRWMIGVSCMSGCPCKCQFCSTGSLPKWRNLTTEEIVAQVEFVLSKHPELTFGESFENKINFTRMGECFLNIENIKEAIKIIDGKYNNVHHFISTIGVKNSDFSWIKDNVTLQLSLHSLDEEHRKELIPFKKLMSIEELGQVRTNSNLKTTLNMTLVNESDFDIEKLQKWFDKDYFFVKLSPINKNSISEKNNLGDGYVEGINLI